MPAENEVQTVQKAEPEDDDKIDLAVEPVCQHKKSVEESIVDSAGSDDGIVDSEPEIERVNHTTTTTLNLEKSEAMEVTMNTHVENQSSSKKKEDKNHTELDGKDLTTSTDSNLTVEASTSSESPTKKGASKRKIRPPRQSNVTSQPPAKKTGRQRKGKKKNITQGMIKSLFT